MTDTQFYKLCNEASKFNASQFITGVLLFNDTEFLQCLEGSLDFLSELFRKISMDSRHHDLQVHCFEFKSERWFNDWAMAGFVVQPQRKSLEEQTAYSLLDQRLQHSWTSLGKGTIDLIQEYAQVKAAVEMASG